MLFISISLLTTDEQLLEILQNVPDMTWEAGINKRFENVSNQEFKAMLIPANMMPKKHVCTYNSEYTASTAFDSRKQWPNCVGAIRDQQQCGSCWAFSAAGAFSDRFCIAGVDKQRVQYSEEYPVACDTMDKGCQGGSLLFVHVFLKHTGTPTAACVSYKSGNGTAGACPTKCDDGSEIKLVKEANYKMLEGIRMFQEQIETSGPIQGQFFVFADFKLYKSGIYQHETGELLGGHAITIVGWGEENGVPYWIVRNSWGPDWGENGYFRIIRGKDECTIEIAAMAPVPK